MVSAMSHVVPAYQLINYAPKNSGPGPVAADIFENLQSPSHVAGKESFATRND